MSVAVATAGTAQAETVSVSIANMVFTPASVAVQMVQGEPGFPDAHGHVTWTVGDTGSEHTVTFDDGRLTSSGRLVTGQRHEVVFTFPGTFPYRCTMHPGETGTVVVSPALPTSSTSPPTSSVPDAREPGTSDDSGEPGAGPAPVVIGGAALVGAGGVAWLLVRRRRPGTAGGRTRSR